MLQDVLNICLFYASFYCTFLLYVPYTMYHISSSSIESVRNWLTISMSEIEKSAIHSIMLSVQPFWPLSSRTLRIVVNRCRWYWNKQHSHPFFERLATLLRFVFKGMWFLFWFTCPLAVFSGVLRMCGQSLRVASEWTTCVGLPTIIYWGISARRAKPKYPEQSSHHPLYSNSISSGPAPSSKQYAFKNPLLFHPYTQRWKKCAVIK